MNEKKDNWIIINKRNNKRSISWAVTWVLTLLIISLGSKFIWDFNPVVSAVAIFINAVIGIGMIRANIQYLNGLDEMQRKLNLEAMAVTLGVSVVGGFCYYYLDVTNVISYKADIGFLLSFISIVYLVVLRIGNKKYK